MIEHRFIENDQQVPIGQGKTIVRPAAKRR
jgi:hypothetical protein